MFGLIWIFYDELSKIAEGQALEAEKINPGVFATFEGHIHTYRYLRVSKFTMTCTLYVAKRPPRFMFSFVTYSRLVIGPQFLILHYLT